MFHVFAPFLAFSLYLCRVSVPQDCSKPPSSGPFLVHPDFLSWDPHPSPYDGSQDCLCIMLKTSVCLPPHRKKSSPFTYYCSPWHWFLRNGDGSPSEFQDLKTTQKCQGWWCTPIILVLWRVEVEMKSSRAFSLQSQLMGSYFRITKRG